MCNYKCTCHRIPLGNCSSKQSVIVGNRSALEVCEKPLSRFEVGSSSLPRPIAIEAVDSARDPSVELPLLRVW